MNKIALAIIVFIFPFTAPAQKNLPADELIKLAEPLTPTHKYVNFDVLKALIGDGWANAGSHGSVFATCIAVQILAPRCLYRTHALFHIAYGGEIGCNAMGWRKTTFEFEKDQLAGLATNADVDKTIQKTGYIGFKILPFIQLARKQKLTVMAGPQLQLNFLGNKAIQRNDKGKVKTQTRNAVNFISLPVSGQVSYKLPSGAMSLGIFFSHDLLPRFKGEDFKSLKQNIAGFTVALII